MKQRPIYPDTSKRSSREGSLSCASETGQSRKYARSFPGAVSRVRSVWPRGALRCRPRFSMNSPRKRSQGFPVRSFEHPPGHLHVSLGRRGQPRPLRHRTPPLFGPRQRGLLERGFRVRNRRQEQAGQAAAARAASPVRAQMADRPRHRLAAAGRRICPATLSTAGVPQGPVRQDTRLSGCLERSGHPHSGRQNHAVSDPDRVVNSASCDRHQGRTSVTSRKSC